MGFLKVCGEDPLLRYIRDTFDANPLRIPDPRIRALTVLAGDNKTVRFSGNLADIVPSSLPPVEETALPDVERTCSSNIAADVLAKLTAPFVAGLTQASSVSITASLAAAGKKLGTCTIRIADARRQFVSPLRLSKQWAAFSPSLLDAWPLLRDHGARLFLVDSVLASGALTYDFGERGSTSANAMMDVLTKAGITANSFSTRDAMLTIRSTSRAVFAFTAIELVVDRASWSVDRMKMATDGLRLKGFDGAPEQAGMVLPHVFGGIDELIGID